MPWQITFVFSSTKILIAVSPGPIKWKNLSVSYKFELPSSHGSLLKFSQSCLGFSMMMVMENRVKKDSNSENP
jgi:hypothetical protein